MQTPNSNRDLHLDYLVEYVLGESKSTKRKHVRLQPGKPHNILERFEMYDQNTFAWKHAQRIEGREGIEDDEGTWPINFWRCERHYGNPGCDLFSIGMHLNETTTSIANAAQEMRLLGYFRIRNSDEARKLLNKGKEIRYSSEITTEWYNPPDGMIEVKRSNPEIVASHAVPLSLIDYKHGESFHFRNSWGIEWGKNGWGSITPDHFDRFIIEAWTSFGAGLFIPYTPTNKIVCLEWKWSLDNSIGVHGREIVDGATSKRLAWAFCIRRDGYLDIDEFYVWPDERRRGYGRVLSEMLSRLASSMNLPLRMLVSYADTEQENLENLKIASGLLNLNLSDSNNRWTHKLGLEKHHPPIERKIKRPKRPAVMLERLRPKDELPITGPIEYTIFFGTNRCVTNLQNGNIAFDSRRDTNLHIGSTTVRIPQTHRFGCKGMWWVRTWNWWKKQNPKVQDTTLFNNDDELRSVLDSMSEAFSNEMYNLLFVHGFNVDFSQAAIQAAFFGVDLKVPGATFLYSWPSAGNVSKYLADEATIEASIPKMQDFVQRILKNTGKQPLNIIVHSMGNRAVLRMLENFRQEPDVEGRIRNVVFAAPDVDTDVFTNSFDRFSHIPHRSTLYTSRGDLAVQSSEWLHAYSRAGICPPLVLLPDLDTVMVEGVNLLDLGHGYYANAGQVLHDMYILFRYSHSDPDNRPGLIRTMSNSKSPYWKLMA